MRDVNYYRAVPIETPKFHVKYIGTTPHTNVWEVVCKKCGYNHRPKTTMLSSQYVECKCGVGETLNYNDIMDAMDLDAE